MIPVLQAALPQALPDQWRDALAVVASGLTWIVDWERFAFGFVATGTNAMIVAKGVLLLLPTALLVAALWVVIVAQVIPGGAGPCLG